MQVVKRDGSLEDVKIEKILHAVNRACRGIQGVEALEVAKRTISGLHQKSTTQELDQLSISNAVLLMAEEPNYSKVAARMLADGIRKEVGRDYAFRDYIQFASQVGLLSTELLALVKDSLDSIEYAIHHERDDLFEYFGLKTIADRYLLRDPQSRRIIERPQWLFMRVALGLSGSWQEAVRFYDVISQFEYMPATPTLFNSGTRHPQMSSCYLLTVGEDSLEGIYKTITDCARLSKFSGGLGVDWTPVRASGALIQGTNGLSNGIIPFLKVFDSSVHAVNQGGKRKGAAAVYLENWHADIEAFLELRTSTGSEERRTHHLNLALWVSNLFMERVERDETWSLFSPDHVPELKNLFGEEFTRAYQAAETAGKALRTIPARALYARMIQTLAETGNGWLCFKDACNARSAQTGHPGRIVHSSNLCTEILEVTSAQETAVCNLGSVNLVSFVGADGRFDFAHLRRVVEIAVSFLDRVVDTNFYPTTEAQFSNQYWRPVGLGLMGLQDLFFRLKLHFTSAEARKLSAQISETIYFEALTTSHRLGQQKGVFPGFAQSRYAQGELQVQLARKHQAGMPELHYDWEKLAAQIQRDGLRNSLLVAIAPTATIASIVGSFESIEPQISNFFKRETLSGEFLQINRTLAHELQKLGLWNSEIRAKIIQAEGSVQGIEEIPLSLREIYRTVWEISQKDLIEMAAMRSPFICQSQSLNLFMENPSTGKVSSMYMYAWKQGIKTTYYLRSRAKTRIQKTTTFHANLDREEREAGSPPVQGDAHRDLEAVSIGIGSPSITDGQELGLSYPRGAALEVDGDASLACSLENPETCESCQ